MAEAGSAVRDRGAPRDDLGRNDARTLDAYGHLNMTELTRPIHVLQGGRRDASDGQMT